MGAAAAGRLVYGHQTAVATTADALLVGFGLRQLLGRGTNHPYPRLFTALPISGTSSPARRQGRSELPAAGLCHTTPTTAPPDRPGPRLVAAIVDRVTFNAHIIETGAQSYRLRMHQQDQRTPQRAG